MYVLCVCVSSMCVCLCVHVCLYVRGYIGLPLNEMYVMCVRVWVCVWGMCGMFMCAYVYVCAWIYRSVCV